VPITGGKTCRFGKRSQWGVEQCDLPARTYSLRVELGIVALILLVWQAVRIPLEGSRRESLSHAGDWLAVERRWGWTSNRH
jgi:hypothetical protein